MVVHVEQILRPPAVVQVQKLLTSSATYSSNSLAQKAAPLTCRMFNVVELSKISRLLWTHSLLRNENDAITGVQTLRNAIMVSSLSICAKWLQAAAAKAAGFILLQVCALLATASAYVGKPDLQET